MQKSMYDGIHAAAPISAHKHQNSHGRYAHSCKYNTIRHGEAQKQSSRVGYRIQNVKEKEREKLGTVSANPFQFDSSNASSNLLSQNLYNISVLLSKRKDNTILVYGEL